MSYDNALQVPPCIHSHERWKLVSTRYAHARISILSCAHCGWIDTEAAIEDALSASPATGRKFFQLVGKPKCATCDQPEGIILNISETGFSVTTGFEHRPECPALRCEHGTLWQDDCAACGEASCDEVF